MAIFNGKRILFSSTMYVTGGDSSGADMLQAMVDNTNSCSWLFYNYTGNTLDISRLDTSNVVDMSHMFRACYNLTTLDLSNSNTSNVTNMSNMFHGCQDLTTISGAINMVSVTTADDMFYECANLTSVNLKNIKTNLQLSSGANGGHLLSAGALINVINELWDMTGSPAKTLTIGSANIAKLANFYVKLISITDAMREADEYIDNKVPCALCESTLDGAMSILDYAQNIKNWVIA